MAHRSNSHRISTEHEYDVARGELDALLGFAGTSSDGDRVDEWIELLENDESVTRFVPDGLGESYKNAA